MGFQDSRNLRLYWIRDDLPRLNLDLCLCAAADKSESMSEYEAISAILSGAKIIVNRRLGQDFGISLKA